MEFLINVHLKDGLPDDGDELLNELEGIADDLLRTFLYGQSSLVYFRRRSSAITAAAGNARDL